MKNRISGVFNFGSYSMNKRNGRKTAFSGPDFMKNEFDNLIP